MKFRRNLINLSIPDYLDLIDNLTEDCMFLKSKNIMDYSLYVVVEKNEIPADTFEYMLGQDRERKKRHIYLSKDAKEIYHFGIIDYLQLWNTSKKVERFYKSSICRKDGAKLSSIGSSQYAHRWIDFISNNIISKKHLQKHKLQRASARFETMVDTFRSWDCHANSLQEDDFVVLSNNIIS